MKGISTIIATIIMVVITIGLISVAYLYMSGLITGTTATNIQLADAYCNSTAIIYLIRNIGTSGITSLTFYMDGTQKTSANSALSCTPEVSTSSPLGASNSTSCVHTASKGIHQIRVVGPSNAAPGTVDC
jgi:hypothetical protein